MIRTSLPFSNRAWVIGHEVGERVRGLGGRLGLTGSKTTSPPPVDSVQRNAG